MLSNLLLDDFLFDFDFEVGVFLGEALSGVYELDSGIVSIYLRFPFFLALLFK